MKRPWITGKWVGSALLALVAASPAYAQFRDTPPEPRPMQFRQDGERPMPMFRNDIRLEHRRQGAKCMNAYPEDHGAFTSCIRNERQSSPFQGQRRQFMPMPGNPE